MDYQILQPFPYFLEAVAVSSGYIAVGELTDAEHGARVAGTL